MGTGSKAAVNRRTPDASRDLGMQRVSRQRVECGASAPLSKGAPSERVQYSGPTPLEEIAFQGDALLHQMDVALGYDGFAFQASRFDRPEFYWEFHCLRTWNLKLGTWNLKPDTRHPNIDTASHANHPHAANARTDGSNPRE